MQVPVVEGLSQLRQEQAPEQPRQHAHRQEEARATGDPALAVRSHPAAGYDAVQVRVVQQVLAPGVQDGDEADLGAQVSAIGGDGAQGLGGGVEQDEGRLVPMLQEWWPSLPGYHLYYANRKQIAPALALVIEALRWREGQADVAI